MNNINTDYIIKMIDNMNKTTSGKVHVLVNGTPLRKRDINGGKGGALSITISDILMNKDVLRDISRLMSNTSFGGIQIPHLKPVADYTEDDIDKVHLKNTGSILSIDTPQYRFLLDVLSLSNTKESPTGEVVPFALYNKEVDIDNSELKFNVSDYVQLPYTIRDGDIVCFKVNREGGISGNLGDDNINILETICELSYSYFLANYITILNSGILNGTNSSLKQSINRRYFMRVSFTSHILTNPFLLCNYYNDKIKDTKLFKLISMYDASNKENGYIIGYRNDIGTSILVQTKMLFKLLNIDNYSSDLKQRDILELIYAITCSDLFSICSTWITFRENSFDESNFALSIEDLRKGYIKVITSKSQVSCDNIGLI